ncbi:hypothetical protein BGZ50_000396 [Haplosporangium sp. Z 11]|nr:hypothetical protein BGZ50_000396 [Haplosporangium sp. Z 11]
MSENAVHSLSSPQQENQSDSAMTSTLSHSILQTPNATILHETDSNGTSQESSAATTPRDMPASTPVSDPEVEQQLSQSIVSASDPASVSASTSVPQQQQPKQVFSLFLTPEQRKQKLEAEGALGAFAKAPGAKRGRKSKAKAPGSSGPISTTTTASTTPKPLIDPKTMIDPNISTTGETHPFFQEVKASRTLAAAGGVNSDTESGWRSSRKFPSKPMESPFPRQHQQFHGTETIDALNGVVARLCGLDTSASPPSLIESLAQQGNNESLSPSSHGSHGQYGWYALRTRPDLDVATPVYKPKPRGKDCWTHWGTNGDQKWREWSEKLHRIQKPTPLERNLVNRDIADQEEFPSCRRVAANQELWQRTWASTLLTTTGMTSGSDDMPSDLKTGELWADKYRPVAGEDVLGNKSNTEYLTQWLKGLEVSGWTLNPEESSAGGGGSGSLKKTSEIMGVAKKRRKRPRRKDISDLDFFIVNDDDDFEDTYGYLSDEDDGFFAAPKPLSSFSRMAQRDHHVETAGTAGRGDITATGTIPPRMLPKKFDIKSNAILLSGPTGSCKTAAVYACAEESGYEVFEVYPGMRRTGKEVLGLVGEMAENHHVHVVSGKTEHKDEIHQILNEKSHDSPVATPEPAPAPAVGTLYSFFQGQQSQQSQQSQRNQQSQQDNQDEDKVMEDVSDVDIEDDFDQNSGVQHSNDTLQTSPSSPGKEESRDDPLIIHEDTLSDLYSLLATTNPRQSLILLEEVDILFEEDKGFWASVMTLLSKSRRPIVMTCNDTSKIPAATLRFQEHLEFTRPGLRELHLYLSSVCKIEGYICSSDYITGLIKHCRYDIRKCLMQLQYDAGVIKNRSYKRSISSSSLSSDNSNHENRRASPTPEPPHLSNGSASRTPSPTWSPLRRKPQRLLRISAKGIVPASAPAANSPMKSVQTPLQDIEQLETHLQYAENMSLMDSQLRMKSSRVIQCYDIDQFEPSKDDVVGQHFSIYKSPAGLDHLLLDQELASIFVEGSESLYLYLTSQHPRPYPAPFDEMDYRDDPDKSLSENFVPLNQTISR